jgi:peptide subunit release factor 1 (eRF1)
MSKQEMREEAERLVREAMEKRNVSVKKGQTRIEAKCGKCGAPNRVSAAPGETRVKYKCKECGHPQNAL